MGFPPYQPSFVELFANTVKHRFNVDIHLFNYAQQGTTTLKGDEDSKRIAEVSPDLVIIAYGINDAVFSTPVKDYISNIQNAISNIEKENPRCEFIIIASSLGNPEVLQKANKLMLDYSTALQALSDSHVVIADMSRLWEYLLTRKKAMDITGNCYNHPNDFGHTLYAESLLALTSD